MGVGVEWGVCRLGGLVWCGDGFFYYCQTKNSAVKVHTCSTCIYNIRGVPNTTISGMN